MKLYEITDLSPDAKPVPEVHVKANNITKAAERAIAAMECLHREVTELHVKMLVDLDEVYEERR